MRIIATVATFRSWRSSPVRHCIGPGHFPTYLLGIPIQPKSLIFFLRCKNRDLSSVAEQFNDARNNLLDRPKTPLSFITAREHSFFRPTKKMSAFAQRLEIRLRRRMTEHLSIHRRRDQNRSPTGEIKRGQFIIGQPIRKLCQQIRRRRRYQQKIGLIGEFDVPGLPVPFIPKIASNRIPAHNLEGQRRNKLFRRARHHYKRIGSEFPKLTDKIGCFISGNRPRYTDDDRLSLKCSIHFHSLPPKTVSKHAENFIQPRPVLFYDSASTWASSRCDFFAFTFDRRLERFAPP